MTHKQDLFIGIKSAITFLEVPRQTTTNPKQALLLLKPINKSLSHGRRRLLTRVGGASSGPTRQTIITTITSRELITSRHFHDISIMDSTSKSGKEHKYNKVNTLTFLVSGKKMRHCFTSSPCQWFFYLLTPTHRIDA